MAENWRKSTKWLPLKREGVATYACFTDGKQILFDTCGGITKFDPAHFPGIPGESWVEAKLDWAGRIKTIMVLHEVAPASLCGMLAPRSRK